MMADFLSRSGVRHLDLAEVPDFELGRLHISPARRRVSLEGRVRDLEPRVMRVLVALAAASPKVVSREQLVETCWDGRIVGDDAVNRCILALRKLARGVQPEPFRIDTVRGVGHSLWANTPDGLPVWDEGASGPRQPAHAGIGDLAPLPPPPRRLLGAALGALALLVGVTLSSAAWRALQAPPGEDRRGQVDVAPFHSLANDAELIRMGVATRGALLRVLRSAGVEVSESAPGTASPAGPAEFHIAGVVDRDGDELVVNAQILDRSRRKVLWSGRVERPMAEPARFQEQAANRIGDVLHCGLRTRTASNRPIGDAVFALVLQACEFRRGGPDDAPRFLAAAERLRAAAPELSIAHSTYATAAAVQSMVSFDAPQAPALVQAARRAARQALALDPRNGEAHFAVGISYGLDTAWAEREASFLRAEALSPGFTVVRNYRVGLLREVGRLRDARELNRRTVADDPFSRSQLSTLIMMTAAADSVEAAEPLISRLELLVSPEDANQLRFATAFWWGDPKRARALLDRAGELSSAANKACLKGYLAALERPPPRRGLPDSCRSLQADWRVRMLARAGDVDGAYEEIARTPPGSQILIALFHPEMRAFRADPRFMPLAARHGLVDYWIKTRRWPDFCTEPERPYDCTRAVRALQPRPASGLRSRAG